MAGTDWRLHASQDTLDAGAELLSTLTPPILPRPIGERIILDPHEVSFNRRQLDITTLISQAGPDFGDAAINQYLAEAGQMGQLAIDYTVPNRTITIPLALRGIPGITFEQARTWLQQKVGLWQRHGGFIKRATTIGDGYAEVVGATLKLGGSGAQALFDVDADATLTLNTVPDWFEDEISLGTITATGDGLFIADPIKGSYPARCRIIITDTSGHDQMGLLVAVHSYNYSADATALVRYNAMTMTGLSGATVQTLAGTYSGSVISTTIPITTDPYNPNWVDVLSTQNATTHVDLTHVGTYRVWVRVRSARPHAAAVPSVSLRFNYDVGDLILGSSNDPARVEIYDDFVILDLGEIRLDRVPIGDHRWQGKVQAMSLHQGSYSTSILENIAIDRMWITPVDEGSTILRSIDPSITPGGVTDAVIFANQTVEVRSDGCWRQASNGIGYGPVSNVTSDLIRLPPSGMENLPVGIGIKPTRGCLDGEYPDSGIDPFTVEVRYRPCSLFTPGT